MTQSSSRKCGWNHPSNLPNDQKFHRNRLEREELLRLRWRLIDVADSLGEDHPFHSRLYDVSLKVWEMYNAFTRVGRGLACDDKEMKEALLEDWV